MARRAAVAAALALSISMMVQLVTAGAAVFVNPEWWVLHGEAIHWFDWLSPVAIVLAFVGRMSRRFRILSGVVLALVFAQYVSAGLRESSVLGAAAALHPLTGFALFWAITELLRRAWTESRT